MNKHGASGRGFLETDVKHFKSCVLRTITNKAEKEYNFYSTLKKRIPSPVYFKYFFHRCEAAFSVVSFFRGVFQEFFKNFSVATYVKIGSTERYS